MHASSFPAQPPPRRTVPWHLLTIALAILGATAALALGVIFLSMAQETIAAGVPDLDALANAGFVASLLGVMTLPAAGILGLVTHAGARSIPPTGSTR